MLLFSEMPRRGVPATSAEALSRNFRLSEFPEVLIAPAQHHERTGLGSAAFGYYLDFP